MSNSGNVLCGVGKDGHSKNVSYVGKDSHSKNVSGVKEGHNKNVNLRVSSV